jgi:hypothetical protein
MARVSWSIEINRPPGEVFAYVADVARRTEWQDAVHNVELQTPGVVGVGMEVLETRQVPGGVRTFRWRVSKYDPPSAWGFEGIDNPLNAIVDMCFVPIANGIGSTVTVEIDFQGAGAARVFAPLARLGARRDVPRDLGKLKRKLEGC